jgi:hypothetical protein
MPRENSFSDSEGRSLTPDLEDEVAMENTIKEEMAREPTTYPVVADMEASNTISDVNGASIDQEPTTAPNERPSDANLQIPGRRPTIGSAADRFRASVRKVMHMHRTYTLLSLGNAGAEPGVDPKRADVDSQFRHIYADCTIEVIDFNRTTSASKKYANGEFVKMMGDAQRNKPASWAKVRSLLRPLL